MIDKSKIKFGTGIRFYFPEFPNHELNGMQCWGCGKYEGTHNGKPVREIAYGMTRSGDEAFIDPKEDFGVDMILVKFWHFQGESEFFYLKSKKN